MLKIFTFFIEPSSYTSDLINNVHKNLGIDYIFLNDRSHAKIKNASHVDTIVAMSLIDQIKFVFSVFKNYEMIIFNGYDRWQFILLFILNLFSERKRIIAIDSDTRYRKRSGLKGFVKKIYLNTIFSQPYIFGFAGGNYSHKDLFRKFGMFEENIFLMPMMVNNRYFFNPDPSDHEKFIFLFVGRMIPLKNIKLLIDQFLNTFAEKKEIQLKIVGGGELFDPLRSKYGNTENILFVGPKYGDDLVKEYHSANVLVLPSVTEQWGLVTNEALCAGLPIIVSDQVGAKYDLVENIETGFVFNLNSPNELGEYMNILYRNKELYKRYSENAKKLMHEEWNYDLYKKNLLESISYAEKVLEQSGRSK